MKETSVEVTANTKSGKIARSQKSTVEDRNENACKWERRKTRPVTMQGKIGGKIGNTTGGESSTQANSSNPAVKAIQTVFGGFLLFVFSASHASFSGGMGERSPGNCMALKSADRERD